MIAKDRTANFMASISKTVCSAAVAMTLIAASAKAETVFQGTVTLRDGTVYEALEIEGFGEITSNRETIQLRFADGTNTEINKDIIHAFDFESINTNNNATAAVITLRNGNTAELRQVRLGSPIRLFVEDPFTMEARWIDFALRRGDRTVARIEFSAMGSSMWSEDSQRVFPEEYRFDPFTGVPLVAR